MCCRPCPTLKARTMSPGVTGWRSGPDAHRWHRGPPPAQPLPGAVPAVHYLVGTRRARARHLPGREDQAAGWHLIGDEPPDGDEHQSGVANVSVDGAAPTWINTYVLTGQAVLTMRFRHQLCRGWFGVTAIGLAGSQPMALPPPPPPRPMSDETTSRFLWHRRQIWRFGSSSPGRRTYACQPMRHFQDLAMARSLIPRVREGAEHPGWCRPRPVPAPTTPGRRRGRLHAGEPTETALWSRDTMSMRLLTGTGFVAPPKSSEKS